MSANKSDIESAFANERTALLSFIGRRVSDVDQVEVLLQSTYERATQSLKEKSVDSIRALLYVIARNLITDYYRQKSFRGQFWVDNHDVETEVSGVSDPERHAIVQERLNIVMAVVNNLPEKCRYSFVEHRLKHRRVEDIAQELELSTSMIKKHIQKAVLAVQSEISEQEND